MNTQNPETYTPLQKYFADGYRVHKFTSSITPVMYPVVAQLFTWRLMRTMVTEPKLWQHLCESVDRITGSTPLAEATISFGPTQFRIHDVLVLATQVEFTFDAPSADAYKDFSHELVSVLLQGKEGEEQDIAAETTTIRLYTEVAEHVTSLFIEYVLTAKTTTLDQEITDIIINAFAQSVGFCLMSFAGSLMPTELEGEDLKPLAAIAMIEWLERHGKRGQKLNEPFNALTAFNGVVLGSLFRKIPKADEYMLLSYHVISNKDYANLSMIDRDYIFYHSMAGKFEEPARGVKWDNDSVQGAR